MAHSIGEHGWRVYETDDVLERIARDMGRPEPKVAHQSVRVRGGWGSEVIHVTVSSDVNGEPYVAVKKEEKMKTRDLYNDRGAPDIHDAEDFRCFMQVMHEAGVRAGFIDEVIVCHNND